MADRNKRLALVLALFVCAVFSAQAQYTYKWDFSGTMGIGVTHFRSETNDFTMSATLGFEKVIRDTRWRLGIESGIMNQGLLDYFFEEDEPDRFVRPNFMYVGALADYSVLGWDIPYAPMNLFLRAGVAPARLSDQYIYHVENKFTMLGIVGLGLDYGPFRYGMTGYINPQGAFVFILSAGICFGKRMNSVTLLKPRPGIQ